MTDGDNCQTGSSYSSELFQRNRYFDGKLLTSEDFLLEQNYFNLKRHLINRRVNGSGIICGLKIKSEDTIIDDSTNTITITITIHISHGLAIDQYGKEISVSSDKNSYKLKLQLNDQEDEPKWIGVYLQRYDIETNPVPSMLSNKHSPECTSCNSRIEENFKLCLMKIKPPVKLAVDKKIYNISDLSDSPTEEGVPVNIELWNPDESEGPVMVKVKLKTENEEEQVKDVILEKPSSEDSWNEQDIFSNTVKLKLTSEDDPDGTTVLKVVKNKINEIVVGYELEKNNDNFSPLETKSKAISHTSFLKYNKLLTQEYLENPELVCESISQFTKNEDNGILLGVLKFKDSNRTYERDDNVSMMLREIVYNNTMLYELADQFMIKEVKTKIIPEVSQVIMVEGVENVTIPNSWSNPSDEKYRYFITKEILIESDRDGTDMFPFVHLAREFLKDGQTRILQDDLTYYIPEDKIDGTNTNPETDEGEEWASEIFTGIGRHIHGYEQRVLIKPVNIRFNNDPVVNKWTFRIFVAKKDPDRWRSKQDQPNIDIRWWAIFPPKGISLQISSTETKSESKSSLSKKPSTETKSESKSSLSKKPSTETKSESKSSLSKKPSTETKSESKSSLSKKPSTETRSGSLKRKQKR